MTISGETYLRLSLASNTRAHQAPVVSVMLYALGSWDDRSSVAVLHFAIVPSRRLPSCRRCPWATTSFHSEPNMRCERRKHTWHSTIEHLQLLDADYGTVLHRTWKKWTYTSCLRNAPTLIRCRFQRSLKIFFVWIVGPRRSVNYFNCAV